MERDRVNDMGRTSKNRLKTAEGQEGHGYREDCQRSAEVEAATLVPVLAVEEAEPGSQGHQGEDDHNASSQPTVDSKPISHSTSLHHLLQATCHTS